LLEREEKVKMKNKQEKGITLIALVVTIVVLLILAGVSIRLVLTNNGVISKAKEAEKLTDEGNAKDIMSLYLAGLAFEKEQDSGFRLADYLSSNIGNDGLEDFLNNGDGHAQVAYKGYKYLVNLDDYSFEYLGKTDGEGVNRHIKQVLDNNNEDVPGIAMVEAGEIETEDLGWKVLSVNSDGTVNLMANKNTGFEVSLSGINGYTNGVKALNEICSKLYGNLEINGVKVLSARSVNAEDFYNIKYTSNGRVYENSKKIQPYINTLDVANNGYSTEQISEYIDVSNTSAVQASNTNMLLANTNPTLRNQNRTNKETVNMISTGNNYWLATRYGYSDYTRTDGTTKYSEDLSIEVYQFNYVRTDGTYTATTLFQTQNNYNTTGSNSTYNCALRPVITVSGDSIQNKTVGTTVTTDPFYKGKTGTEAHGYVKADSIASLLGVDIKSVNKINSGLPTKEADMTWTKLEDGGYDSLTGEFDTEHYDYYIADRTTNLQMRLTGAAAYNNGVLAMDTVCKNLYGNLTEIKLSNGKTKKVNVVVARNAKFEDFVDDSKLSGSYGGVWSTNANDSTAPNKITSTNNRYAPTLFTQYENIDKSNGASKGYSDAKISSYNLSNAGTSSFVSTEEKSNYAYEKYNVDPGLKVIYNAYWGGANRNTARINIGREYWLSSRCVDADWYYSHFYLRYVSGGSIMTNYVFYSSTYANSNCRSLRPVLQVSK
jgi:hypothetical protein